MKMMDVNRGTRERISSVCSDGNFTLSLSLSLSVGKILLVAMECQGFGSLEDLEDADGRLNAHPCEIPPFSFVDLSSRDEIGRRFTRLP